MKARSLSREPWEKLMGFHSEIFFPDEFSSLFNLKSKTHILSKLQIQQVQHDLKIVTIQLHIKHEIFVIAFLVFPIFYFLYLNKKISLNEHLN